jgi:hypothetical protein
VNEMGTPKGTPKPRTEAGRRIVDMLPGSDMASGLDWWTGQILAIEAEAAQLAVPSVERLTRALRKTQLTACSGNCLAQDAKGDDSLLVAHAAALQAELWPK